MPSEPSPIDTIRLGTREKRKLMEQIHRQSANVRATMERRAVRVEFAAAKALIQVTHPIGTTVRYAVVPRNLSRRGVAFIHGRFLYPDSPCDVLLPMLDGQWQNIHGKILRCRHVSGLVHEVSVLFDQPIVLADFVTLTREEQLRHEEELDEARAHDAAEAGGVAGHALVIDEFRADRRLFVHWLGKFGLQASEAAGVLSANRLLRRQTFDLLVLNVDEGLDSSLELVRNLRRAGFAGPIVAVSADDQGQAERAALEAGASAFLPKPCDPQALQFVVEQLLSLRVEEAGDEPPLVSTLADSEELRPLIREFVNSLGPLSSQLRQAMAAGDHDRVAQLARQLKGAGSSYGFEPITVMARHLLDQLADAPEPEALAATVADLDALLRRARVGAASDL